MQLDSHHAKPHGNLTIRDITRPVMLDVEYQGKAKSPWGTENYGFNAKTKINRKAWGLEAKLLVARRGDALKIEGVSDPADLDRELYETGALLPGPNAILAGPTFEEWLDPNYWIQRVYTV